MTKGIIMLAGGICGCLICILLLFLTKKKFHQQEQHLLKTIEEE